MDPRLLFGLNVARLRQARGWSQTQLANRIDPSKLLLGQSYLSKIERGEKNVTISTMAILAEALEATLADLVHEDVD